MAKKNKKKTRSVRPLIAIGDIHGRLDLLRTLMEKIDKKMKDRDYRLIFLGDYVDRGPDSARVIDFLLEVQRFRPDTVFLKGNHEEALLDFLGVGEGADGWLAWGGEETLKSYGVGVAPVPDIRELQQALAAALPAAHFDFLMGLSLLYEEEGHIFVHAGLNPDYPIEEQESRDLLWIRKNFYDHGEGVFPDHVIIHGHTPVKKPENVGWRINIDTGAVWSGILTAVILDGDEAPKFVKT